MEVGAHANEFSAITMGNFPQIVCDKCPIVIDVTRNVIRSFRLMFYKQWNQVGLQRFILHTRRAVKPS